MNTTRHTTRWTLTIVAVIAAGLCLSSCDSFLKRPPTGSLTKDVLANQRGVETLLTGAYGALDAKDGIGLPWATAASDWIYGSVAGGVAHKGSDPTDQTIIATIARWETSPVNPFLNAKWVKAYEGISRANSVLSLLPEVTDATETWRNRMAGEARFLRGHYYFDLKKMFNNVPWIDEDTENLKQPNTGDSLWIKIEADFRFAMNNLPETQAKAGRANKWAAAAYLAKAYLYQGKWQEAADLFDKVISQGVTSSGEPYELLPRFNLLFRATVENHSGVIFALQATAQDGTGTNENGRPGDVLNFPYGGPFSCCGFFQPTQDLVNSYRTDPETGLPLIVANNGVNSIGFSEPLEYNADPVKSDLGIPSDQRFTPSTKTLDPRLDWTVGRRGLPYHDWGPFPGQIWIRNQRYSGPYELKKSIYWRAMQEQFSNASRAIAINYAFIRFADVLLMAAEAHAHLGNLEQARRYVNRVRARVADPNPADGEDPEGWVSNDMNKAFAAAVVDSEAEMEAADVDIFEWVVRTDLNSTFVLIDIKQNGARVWNEYEVPNYQIGLYPGPWTSKEKAFQRIYFERKLELAMEGHRFFDLSRWHMAEEVLNQYYDYEGSIIPDVRGAQFTAPKNRYFPIPQRQIDLSIKNGEPTLQQNPGY